MEKRSNMLDALNLSESEIDDLFDALDSAIEDLEQDDNSDIELE